MWIVRGKKNPLRAAITCVLPACMEINKVVICLYYNDLCCCLEKRSYCLNMFADLNISKSMFRNVLAGGIFFVPLDSAVVSPPGAALVVNMI